VVKVTAAANKRLSLATLIAVKPGCRARLIYRLHTGRKGFTKVGYAPAAGRRTPAARRPARSRLGTTNAHSAAMAELIAVRSWPTIFRLPRYALELNPVEAVCSHLKWSLANLTKHRIDSNRCSTGPASSTASSPRPGLDRTPM